MRIFAFAFLAVLATHAADPASDLAARLKEPDGTSYVRLRMEIQQPPGQKKATLQLQIKTRRSGDSAAIVYQVLWPGDRKGEAVLLRQSGRSASAVARSAGGEEKTTSQMTDPLFGSDLALADPLEDFFRWSNQALAGNETIDGIDCQILESKPGPADFSIYGRVRSWIDPRRLVPLRVEKYSPDGKLLRRIDTTRVTPQGGRNMPAGLSVRGAGGQSLTALDGSRLQRDVNFTEAEFAPQGLKNLKAPASMPTP